MLLDFGAARRAVAEMSRTLTGIVKAGYSPHEQYSTDSRLQGPWSDIYALGGTLYRAVTGRPPEEATLRVDEDHMPSAAQAARKGGYRPGFLAAIDACLKVRHAERPRSVAQLRPMMLGRKSQPRPGLERFVEAFKTPSKAPMKTPSRAPSRPGQPSRTRRTAPPPPRAAASRMWPAIAAAVVAILGGAYGGFEYLRWQPTDPVAANAEVRRQASATEGRLQASADTVRRQADIEAERVRQDEAAAAARRQAELDAERQRTEAAEASRRQAELEAEQRRKEETERVAAADAARRDAEAEEARRKAEENARVASATLNTEQRVVFVRQVQQVLKQGRCYDGAMNGHSNESTQDALDNFVANAGRKGKPKPARIELAKATAGDFETWLREAGAVTGNICAQKPKPPKQEVAKPARQHQRRGASAPQGGAACPGAPGGERAGPGKEVLLGPPQRAETLLTPGRWCASEWTRRRCCG